jgi:hypothetical protein
MGDKISYLLRSLIWLCVFGAASGVVAGPVAALQIRTGPDSARSSGTGSYTLSGIVVDASTGAPIRRALVKLEGAQSQLMLTDDNGKFHFENLAQGAVGINAQKPGYSDRPSEPTTMVTIGADTRALVLKLEPESAIAVKVTGEDGEGVEGLPVRVIRSLVQEGRRYWEPHGGGQTNAQGEFKEGSLLPGKYYVSVGPSFRPVGHIGEGAQESDVGYSRVFYPNAVEMEGAAPVEVNPGRRSRLEFTLSTVPLYRISGALLGGTPGEPCQLRLTDSSGEDMPVGLRMNPATGMFRSGEIPAGFYTLVAGCIGAGRDSLVGRMPLHVDSNIANVTLSVAATVSIPVVFRTNEGGADANENSPAAMVILKQSQGRARNFGTWSDAESDEDKRRMVVTGVEPGIYSVDLRANPGWYVESARYGVVDLLTEDLTVPEGGTTEGIEIALKNDGASVSGNVHAKGTAPESGRVLMVPSHAPRLVKATRITNGTYIIKDLAPGSYRTIALDRADDIEYTNPEALRDYLSKAEEVTLGPKQESRVDLELQQREK